MANAPGLEQQIGTMKDGSDGLNCHQTMVNFRPMANCWLTHTTTLCQVLLAFLQCHTGIWIVFVLASALFQYTSWLFSRLNHLELSIILFIAPKNYFYRNRFLLDKVQNKNYIENIGDSFLYWQMLLDFSLLLPICHLVPIQRVWYGCCNVVAKYGLSVWW